MKTNTLKLFERVLRDARNQFDHINWHFFIRRDICWEDMLSEALRMTWDKVSQCRGEGGLTPLAAEKGVRMLMERGVAGDRIRFRDGTFRVQLEHTRCKIQRDGYRCLACCIGDRFATRWKEFNVCPEALADLLLDFDASVPEMTRRTRLLFEDYLEMKREAEKKELIQKIRLQTIKATR